MSLDVTVDSAVATLLLNRPEKRNAITFAMWEQMPRVLGELAEDTNVRVLVVRGAGGHFSAGADIGELGSQLEGDARSYGTANRDAEDALATFPKPTVAHIEGDCIGGGCEIAVACDLRFAATTARFGITPARLGLVYPAFAVERVVHLIGPAAAKRLLFSAELIDAEKALRLGLVDDVFAEDQLEGAVGEFTTTLGSRSLLTQQAVKQMIASLVDAGRIDPAVTRFWQEQLRSSADREEGIRAFMERRTPRFRWSGPSA